jgi:hypothetical protein
MQKENEKNLIRRGGQADRATANAGVSRTERLQCGCAGDLAMIIVDRHTGEE